jgi:hypothetical protein
MSEVRVDFPSVTGPKVVLCSRVSNITRKVIDQGGLT